MQVRGFFALAIAAATAQECAARDILVADQSAFAAAVKDARPGDSIVLADGEWRNFEMVFTGEGLPGKPITLTAQTKGRVVLTGQSNLRLGGSHLVVSGLVFRDGYSPSDEVISFRRDSRQLAHHSRITEVVIDGFSKPDRRAEDIWVALYGTHNRVDHSHLEGKTNAGVTLAVIRREGQPLDNRHRIDHVYFGPRPTLGSNGGETIRVGTSEESLSNSNTLIERNIFDRCSGEVEIVSIKSGGNIVRENLVLSSQGAFVLRHGNGNLVERNIFFGNGLPDTGGVRIINRDQIVRGNYFEGLRGTDFTSAISMMNGVPNSAINRYHQVSGALVEKNSVIDAARITFAAGADAERSAAPVDSQFRANLVTGTKRSDPFRAMADISGIGFEGNVAARVAERELSRGIDWREVELERAANGLLYPLDPALDGVGAPRDLTPVRRDEVGVPWYRAPQREPAFGSGEVIALEPGQDLAAALAASKPGDRLKLGEGSYMLEAPVTVRHRVTLAGEPGLATRLRLAGGLARIEQGGGLELSHLDIDASGASGAAALVEVAAGAAPNYAISFDNVAVRGPGRETGFNGLVMAPGTLADTISIRSSRFSDMATVIAATGEQSSNGWYPVERLSIENSHFDRIALAADLLRKGRDESTFGPRFTLAGSSIADSGAAGASLRLWGVQHARIEGNSFARSEPIHVIHTVGTPRTRIADNRFTATPAPRIEEIAHEGPHRARLSNNILEDRP